MKSVMSLGGCLDGRHFENNALLQAIPECLVLVFYEVYLGHDLWHFVSLCWTVQDFQQHRVELLRLGVIKVLQSTNRLMMLLGNCACDFVLRQFGQRFLDVLLLKGQSHLLKLTNNQLLKIIKFIVCVVDDIHHVGFRFQ